MPLLGPIRELSLQGKPTPHNLESYGKPRKSQLGSAYLGQKAPELYTGRDTMVILMNCWRLSLDSYESEKLLGNMIISVFPHFHKFSLQELNQVLTVNN